MSDMFNILEKLCTIPGVSGDEGKVRDYIYGQLSEYAGEIKTDALGNLMIFKKGRRRAKRKLMVSAHMDEVGLMVSGIKPSGMLEFVSIGGIDRRTLTGKRVLVGGMYGVIGCKPIHLSKGAEREQAPGEYDLYIDIGAKDDKEASDHVKIGDYAVFDTQYENFGDNMIKARALDNRAGCAVLMEMCKSDMEYDMYFSFVVQEEVGLRGAKTAAFDINPDSAIVLETTTAADIIGVEKEKQVCRLGDGPAISFMDKRTIYDREYYEMAFKLAKENDIKCQPKTMVAGGNDAGAIHISRGGVRTMAISLPCRYLHSPAGVVSKQDLADVLALAKICADTIASQD